MSNNEFIVCHRKYKGWICKDGFSSISDTYVETSKLLSQNPKMETRLFVFNRHTPKSIQQSIIKWNLSTFNVPPVKFT